MRRMSSRQSRRHRERKQTDVQDTRSYFCLRRAGIILGIVRRPGRRRMRDRFSPRPVWRLPAEWRRHRHRAAGGRGTGRGRGTARRLRGRIPLASAVPALRRALIAAARGVKPPATRTNPAASRREAAANSARAATTYVAQPGRGPVVMTIREPRTRLRARARVAQSTNDPLIEH
jgi:hypothetical protein